MEDDTVSKIHAFIIRALVGARPPYPTGAERIRTLRDAIVWRLAGLPGWDASVGDDGRVTVWRCP